MITTCFARAAQRWTSRICVHVLFTFQEVTPISKTRNQLTMKCLTGEHVHMFPKTHARDLSEVDAIALCLAFVAMRCYLT
jgi:hypothetical protein